MDFSIKHLLTVSMNLRELILSMPYFAMAGRLIEASLMKLLAQWHYMLKHQMGKR